MSPSQRLFLAPVLALALAVAGCGSSDNNDFVDGYNRATAPLQDLSNNFGSGKQAQQRLETVADKLDAVQSRLAQLEPPDGARAELDRMLAAIEDNSEQVRALAKAVKSGSVDKLTAASEKYSKAGDELVKAEQALRDAVEN
jgi:hypothetical protein